MLPLDDFIGHVATSGLVAPEVLAHVRGQLEPEPAGDASVRLARRLIEGGWLTTYQAKKLLARRDPRVLPGRLPADATHR